MSAGFVLYVALIVTLAAGTGWAVEALSRQLGKPTRWAWLVAFGLALAVIASAMAKVKTTASTVMLARVTLPTATPATSAQWTLLRTLRDFVSLGATSVASTMDEAVRAVPAGLAVLVGSAWLLLSLVALVLLSVVHLRIRRARREWAEAELFGTRVRIAPDVGPAVVGVVRPQIVVPRWLLSRSPSEQALVLAHEREHLRGRDHLLLSAGCMMVALMPWHPVAWWMLSRLRLAIELDCDARVLRRGVPVRTYGTLLIDLADRCSGFRVGATALADEGSHLERRLLAMKTGRTKRSLLRAGVLGTAATLALLAACEAKVPTGPEIQAMDVASARKAVTGTRMLMKSQMDSAVFYVDDKQVDSKTANSLTPNQIATIDINKTDDARSIIRITTNGQAPDPNVSGKTRMRMTVDAGARKTELSSAEQPLILIDGAKADDAKLHALKPDQIAAIDVIKGAAAQALSSDPAAKNGIIKVTTKK
jgi:beta-lactamase regulating signal transducer with metallopeptidase domain